MTGVRIGGKESKVDELLEVFKSEEAKQMELGMFPVISQWVEFAGYLDLPIDLRETLVALIQKGNTQRHEAVKVILIDWIKREADKANLGAMLIIVENNFKWEIVTGFLRKRIQMHAKTFNELDEGSRMQLMNLQFVFLGRQTSLHSLRNLVSQEKFDDIINSIDNYFIVEVLQNNTRQFDKFLLPPEPKNYISRTVEVKRKLSPKIFQIPGDDIFIFEPKLLEGLDLSLLVRPNPADASGAQVHSLTVRFILLEEEEHFSMILEKTTSPVHRIKYYENSYFWISTVGSIRLIRKFLSDEVEEISEGNFIKETILDSTSKPIAICGGPGTGKSVLLASLANKIFQKYSNHFVFFLNFPNTTRQHNFLGIKEGSKVTATTKQLTDLFGSTFKMDTFSRTILKALMSNNKTHFDVFLDRFDEIPFEDISRFSRAKKLLKLLHSHPNIRIYLSFGPTVRIELENHLQIISHNIFPFREDEIEFFLSTTVASEVCQLVLRSLDLINKNEDLHKETAGRPLQCSMLIELYSNTIAKTTKTPIKSLPELYSKYLEAMYKSFWNEDLPLLKLLHYREAFNKYFSGNINAESILQALNKHTNKFTLSEGPYKAVFEHKTFSEYLMAQFIVEHWKGSNIVDRASLCQFIYGTLLSTCRQDDNSELPETFDDLEYDTLGSVLLKMGAGNSVLNDTAVTLLINLGWNHTLELLQTSVLKGQLTFRYSAICYFLNDIISNDESLIFTSYKQNSLSLCPDSLQHFGLISKDFVSKVLVSLSFSFKHLFQLTTELVRETKEKADLYVDSRTCQTILVLAVRQDDVETFSYFRKLLEMNRDTDITSIRFHCDILKNMIYEHTPLHEAAKCGNYQLFEYLFKVYKDKIQSMPGLVQVCLADSSRNVDDVIKNKIKILRLMSSKYLKYDFKNIKRSFLDGIHVTLFTKVCDMISYTISDKDVKWLYKFVVCYFTKIDQMDVFVNWLISKDLTRILLYSYDAKNSLVIDALRQNVLGSKSLESIYHSLNFDLGSIVYFVLKCKNRQTLVKTMIDLSGEVSLEDKNDPTIFHWATCLFESDPMNYASFDKSDRANMNQRLADYKMMHIQLHDEEIRRIISKHQSITDSSQILYNPNEILGKGTFSIVYRGKLNGRHVAVKKIYYKADQEERVGRETNLLLECDGHENIIKCFYVQRTAVATLIALELCKFNLEQWVHKNGSTDVRVQALQILNQVVKGLGYLHSKNVVHLGITPQNILLAPIHDKFKVKISDFGNSRKLSVGKTRINLKNGTGTIEWMAPEVIKMTSEQNLDFNLNLTTSADIFSMGCVFYYVLSKGVHPFGARGAEIESNIQLNNPCVNSILLKEPLFIHLFLLLANQKQEDRPTAAALIKHHIFWSEKKMLSFLVAVSNAADQPTVTSEISEIMNRVENYPLLKPYYEPEDSKGWIRFLCQDIQNYVSGIGCKRKPYHGDLFFDLVRAIRNMQAHRFDLPKNVQLAVGAVPNSFMKYWLKRFAIIFEVIWLHFEVMKDDASSALSEYYSNEYDFNREEISERADKILTKYIRIQCAEMILRRITY